MHLNPRKNRVVLKRIEQELTTEGGIIIAAEAKKEENIGEVLVVGDSVKDLRPGNRVVFDQYHFDKVMIKNEELIIIDEQYILATIL